MSGDRWLTWEGCVNTRDLGALPTVGGGRTRDGAVVRTDSCHLLTDVGWAAAWDHGVRTVVDLRHPGEIEAAPPVGARPEGISMVPAPVEDEADVEFIAEWGVRLATPAYYGAALDRYADRIAAAITAIAQAPPGGVAIHCVAGRDRAGMVTVLLLALAEVEPDAIVADHALSYERLPNLHGADGPSLPDGWRADHDATLRALLADLDAPAYLRGAGVAPADLDALRSRLVAR